MNQGHALIKKRYDVSTLMGRDSPIFRSLFGKFLTTISARRKNISFTLLIGKSVSPFTVYVSPYTLTFYPFGLDLYSLFGLYLSMILDLPWHYSVQTIMKRLKNCSIVHYTSDTHFTLSLFKQVKNSLLLNV